MIVVTIWIFIIPLCLQLFSPAFSDCSLNFTTFPYKPTGGCGSCVHEKLEGGYGFPRTPCCQNALLVLSNALALRSFHDSSSQIFLRQDEWNSCISETVFPVQPNVSFQTCGFKDFFHGSGKCSSQLTDIDMQNVTSQCVNFDRFDDACGICTSAITKAVDQMTEEMEGKGNHTEKTLCLVSVIVSVIAKRRNVTSGDAFNRCLLALATPEPENFIKLPYGVAEALLTVICVVIGLTVAIYLIRCIMASSQKKQKAQDPNKNIVASCPGLYWFSKAEINSAIYYNGKKMHLGRGSAGLVYKGMLPSGQVVAIKQIYKSNTSDSFTREIQGLSRVRHPNLVYLFGCCVEEGEQYLVYEYCSKGNLAQHLLNKDTALTWETRIKILRDCAFALKYLHNHIDGCIVHRDIKLTNILLTEEMVPKLSDFGLARIVGMEESKVYTDVRGTIGYMDPEYMSNAKLTSASDIYSFGIVILQLLSGQKVIDLDLDNRDQLTRKARDVNMGKRPITDFQDPRMKANVINVDFESILQIAVLCVASSSTGRPTIDLVFYELDKACKNTRTEMQARKDKCLLPAMPSKSRDLIQV